MKMPPILVDNITYVTKIDHSYDVKVQFFVWRVATGVQMSLRNSGDLVVFRVATDCYL